MVKAIVLGIRQEDWAGDYPTRGDRHLAALLASGHRESEPWCHYAVRLHSGLVIGGAGFHGPPVNATVEIGYGLAPSQRGRGYAREAVRLLVEAAAASSYVHAVRAVVKPDNVASQRVLEAEGFPRQSAEPDHITYLLEL